MTGPGEPSPPAGHPGPRWRGDGSLGGAPPAGGPGGAPVASAPTAEAEADRDYASFWRRMGAWLVDEAVKTFLWLTIMMGVILLTGSVPQPPSDDLDLVSLLPRLVLSVGYDWLFWTQGWTPGANVVGVRIVRADGAPPGPARAAVRVGGAMVSSAPLFLGYIWMVRSKRNQTWHDSFAGTYVVNVSAEERRRQR